MAPQKFNLSFGKLLGIAHTMLFRKFSQTIKEKELPITPDQFRVMSHLWQKNGCSQQHLANSTDRDRANITRIIDILEREGLVQRLASNDDKRSFNIELTQKGIDLEPQAAACGKQAIGAALKGISSEEIETCTLVLQKIIHNLKQTNQ